MWTKLAESTNVKIIKLHPDNLLSILTSPDFNQIHPIKYVAGVQTGFH